LYVTLFFLSNRRVKAALKPVEKEDEDVDKERQRIERGGGINDILRLDNLTKVRSWFDLHDTSKANYFLVKMLVNFVTTQIPVLAFFYLTFVLINGRKYRAKIALKGNNVE